MKPPFLKSPRGEKLIGLFPNLQALPKQVIRRKIKETLFYCTIFYIKRQVFMFITRLEISKSQLKKVFPYSIIKKKGGNMKIILASSSPRRRDLMDLAKIEYEAMPSNFDEKVDEKLSLEDQSIEIAYGKAKDIFEKTQEDRVVIGSDTLVIVEGKKFGKAKNRLEAIKMLQQLQGKVHSIYTSLAILIKKQGNYKEYKELHEVKVFVRQMSDREIEDYVDSEKPFYCAGAYAIQGFFAIFVDKIEGDYPTALGLPINRVYNILKENDIV